MEGLPAPCRTCLFWEAGAPPPTKAASRRDDAARLAKESWWQATALEWGACGLGLWTNGTLLGYTMVTPPAFLEQPARLGRVTEDALLLAVLWTADDVDTDQVALELVEGALRLVIAHGARALEAFASPTGRDPCIPAEDTLRACGFTLRRSADPYSLYRLDLRQTARWHESVEEALRGLRQVLGRRRLGRVPSMPAAGAPRMPPRRT